MAASTLADKVLRDFSRVKIKKASVKVPKLKFRKAKVVKTKKEDRIPMSSIVNILIKSSVEKVKREKKEKAVEDEKNYTILKEERAVNIGGYGTVSGSYGTPSQTAYIDYGKLFSYLGKFKAKTPYENMAEHVAALNTANESGSFTLFDRETMEKGARYARYFAGGQDLNPSSLVPVAGMSSAEWEQFKLWMKLDPVMYRLKTSTS